jgi:hypothetical protein
MRGKCVALSQTATPSSVETEVAAFWRKRDVHVSTERKLAIDAIPDKYKDHGAEHLRRRLPEGFSGMSMSIVSVVILVHIREYFCPLVWVLSKINCRFLSWRRNIYLQ